MKTGIFGGFLTGTAASALVLGAASVLTFPEAVAPDATAVDVPAGSEFRQSREDTQASLPASDDTPGAAEKPRIDAPEPDDLASLEGAATAPATPPSAGTAETGLTAPDAPDAPSGVDLDAEEPVLQSPQALAPEVPEGEETLSISTEPAQPVQPDVEEGAIFEDDDQAAVTPAPDALPQTDAEPDAETDAESAPDVQTEISEPAPAPEAEPVPDVSTVTEAEPETEPDTAPDTVADTAPEEEIAALVAPETEPQTEPSSTIGNLAEDVTVGRLPSVGAPDAGDEDVAEGAAPAPAPEGLTPLERYSVEFENPEGKPLMSFVLLDQGDSPINFEALAEFPYPISYAVDVTWSGAGAAMERYRAAGLEVLAMIDLPEGARASDAEVAMQTYLAALPETVAVMEGVGSGLQSSREATEQLIPILQESGHGLVLFSEGFDTAQKLIAREGVPALSVFRDIDSNGQTATVIRRFLDQAAFRAGQEEGGVIIVGRLRAETVSALLLWGLQDRANSVAIAPVSALLKEQVAE
ncbi:MAG: divergent polysaccharide deacetylase family protein [Pseudomonadota bacterium]